ncbi:hypothetical protein MHEL_14320 [Mycolicibacterium helvum]|uniref:Uncharacterized protein n=2 Tax=Mycolicibacterium helvum TaxID=1534349 RepID=A0A7I7T3Z8_9MYCO|nr:hypothetical protein MHEL_14320 [Mycolicibacterium helvum]
MVGMKPAHSRCTGLVTYRLNLANHCGSCIRPSNSEDMADLKPPWFTASVFNKVAMATAVSGCETLTVTARASGQDQKIPVITVDVDDVS